MRKLFLFSVLILLLLNVDAQVLYTTTSEGGINNGGTISKLDSSSQTLTTTFSFDDPGGYQPQFTKFIEASDGKLYSMTLEGGSKDLGVIFSYDPATSLYKTVRSFDSADGCSPYGGIIQASDGKLYGMTQYGGNNNLGVLFSYDLTTSVYTKLKDFNGPDGSTPWGSLIQAADGKLYGMTTYGGTGYGIIFSYDITTSTFTKLMNFDKTNGAWPCGSLVQAPDGKLYGMTNGGGIGTGVIFSYEIATNIYAKLKSFTWASGFSPVNADGAFPYGDLTCAADGKLYGVTFYGGTNGMGVIFSYDPSASVFTKLRDFDRAGGGKPFGGLVQASDGKLYGITPDNGLYYGGTIFSYDPVSLTYSDLIDLEPKFGSYSYGSLMRASDGKLYGMAGGGLYKGFILSYDPTSSLYTKLKDLGTNNTGSAVQAGIIKDKGKKIYGVASVGGYYGRGSFFSYDLTKAVFTNLEDFDGVNGANPKGKPIFASDGKLYGVTSAGGEHDEGTLFSFDTSTQTFTKLYDFSGFAPYGNLIQASDGMLYGLTSGSEEEGDWDGGEIYAFNPVTSTYKTLYSFRDYEERNPFGSLVQASDGKLYGMTSSGGSNKYGTIFSYTPATSTYRTLYIFDGAKGGNPYGSLVQATDGKLYGMTSKGGVNDCGVLFSYDPFAARYTRLRSFSKANGQNPYGSLFEAPDKKLYGMTYKGGKFDSGVSFIYDPVAATYTKLLDFNGRNGAHPLYTSFIELPGENTPAMLSIADASATEGSTAIKQMKFTVSLNVPVAGKVNVNYQTIDGSAIAGSDYVSTSGVLSFPKGSTQKIIRVPILNDSLVEPGESFTVLLSNPVNAGIADGSATGTIINDDNLKLSAISKLGVGNDGAHTPNNTMRVWPNPAKDFINVQLDGSCEGNTTLQLQDMRGNVLKQLSVNVPAKGITQQINTPGMASGDYLLVVIKENGKMQSEKIIIQR